MKCGWRSRTLIKVALLGGLVTASLSLAYFGFQRFQASREADARLESRQLLRNRTSDELQWTLKFFRSHLLKESPELKTYLNTSLIASTHLPQPHPESNRPLPISAAISRGQLGLVYFEYAFVDYSEQTEKLVILDGDQVLGEFYSLPSHPRTRENKSHGFGTIEIGESNARWTGDMSREVITLPPSALSHPLRLKLIGPNIPDSTSIPIFVDPTLLPNGPISMPDATN